MTSNERGLLRACADAILNTPEISSQRRWAIEVYLRALDREDQEAYDRAMEDRKYEYGPEK